MEKVGSSRGSENLERRGKGLRGKGEMREALSPAVKNIQLKVHCLLTQIGSFLCYRLKNQVNCAETESLSSYEADRWFMV